MNTYVFPVPSDSTPEVSLIVPVYKEDVNIRPFLARAEAVFDRMHVSYEIIFALDPSPDKTEDVIQEEINHIQASSYSCFLVDSDSLQRQWPEY